MQRKGVSQVIIELVLATVVILIIVVALIVGKIPRSFDDVRSYGNATLNLFDKVVGGEEKRAQKQQETTFLKDSQLLEQAYIQCLQSQHSDCVCNIPLESQTEEFILTLEQLNEFIVFLPQKIIEDHASLVTNPTRQQGTLCLIQWPFTTSYGSNRLVPSAVDIIPSLHLTLDTPSLTGIIASDKLALQPFFYKAPGPFINPIFPPKEVPLPKVCFVTQDSWPTFEFGETNSVRIQGVNTKELAPCEERSADQCIINDFYWSKKDTSWEPLGADQIAASPGDLFDIRVQGKGCKGRHLIIQVFEGEPYGTYSYKPHLRPIILFNREDQIFDENLADVSATFTLPSFEKLRTYYFKIDVEPGSFIVLPKNYDDWVTTSRNSLTVWDGSSLG